MKQRFRIFPTLLIWDLAIQLGGIVATLLVLQASVRTLVLQEMRREGLAMARMWAAEFNRVLENYPREQWTHPEVQQQLMQTYQEHARLLGVVWTHIYDRDLRLIFSPDTTQIGLPRSAIEAGGPLHLETSERGEVLEVHLLYPRELGPLRKYIAVPVVEVYYARFSPDMDLAIIEVYMDATAFVRRLNQISRVIGGTLLAAALVLGSLTFVLARRADRVLEQQFRALEEAYTQLATLQEMRTRLIHMLTHDLRNHLAVLVNGLELLPVTSPADREIQQDMRAALEHSLMLLHNLQDLERLQQATMPVRIRPLKVRPVLEAVYRGLRLWEEARNKQCEIDVRPESLSIDADPELFRRVLLNLLHNAFRYTPENGLVRMEARPAEDGWAEVRVQDTGPGIPRAYQERIFEPFFRVPERQGGTGLGLAFCKLAVEAMGGSIRVESEEGRGTTFIIRLHRAEPNQAASVASPTL